VIASVHVADLRAITALSAARRKSLQRTVTGLRHANLAFAAPLGPSVVPGPSLHRVVMVAMWDGDAALERFHVIDHFAEVFQNGWHVRLQPLRASGSWPGLDLAIPRAREVPHEGPVAVLTLGRLRARRAVDFFRTSARAPSEVRASADSIVPIGDQHGSGVPRTHHRPRSSSSSN
jgi:hypothetical protein